MNSHMCTFEQIEYRGTGASKIAAMLDCAEQIKNAAKLREVLTQSTLTGIRVEQRLAQYEIEGNK